MTAQRRTKRPRRAAVVAASVLLAAGISVVAAGARAHPRQESVGRVTLTGSPSWSAEAAGPAVPQQAAAPQTAGAPRQATPVAQRGPQPGCERCHGELELLRQQTGSLARAQEVFVSIDVIAHSAHAASTCADCHSGYGSYPHVARQTATQTCASCHTDADALWAHGAHATADEPVSCAQCHGSHAIVAIDTARTTSHAATLNAPCIACHGNAPLPAHEPHAQDVSCARCHAPHDTRPTVDPDGWLAPVRQAQTCGACHADVAAAWVQDIHGDAVLRNAHLAGREAAAENVTCTSCHVGHDMLSTDAPGFAALSVARCSACHETAARTFYNSYHGRATALGSRVSASCADCHGAHDILPDSMPASHVAPANLVETCGGCHEHARPAFVKYDSHPDPFNRARNPWIFYSFFGMNALLVFVLVVFGGHTLLWWLRLWLDRRRGIIHGIGVHGDHETHGEGH